MDDINYLLYRRQVSQRLADRAACESARAAHQELADRYGALIRDYRDGSRSATRVYLSAVA